MYVGIAVPLLLSLCIRNCRRYSVLVRKMYRTGIRIEVQLQVHRPRFEDSRACDLLSRAIEGEKEPQSIFLPR